MKNKFKFLRYLSPFLGILFCPVTILFLWSISSNPAEKELPQPFIGFLGE